MVTTSSSSGTRVHRLPIVVERGLASTRLANASLSSAFALKVGLDDTTCRKGCTHCCSYPLTISLWEGLSLYQALKARGLWRSSLKDELDRHSSLTFGTAPEVWMLAGIACPLLAGELCIAYEHRPFRCRVTVSRRDPDLCRPVHFGQGTFVDNQLEASDFEAVERQASRASREHVRGMEQRVPLSTAVLVGHQIAEGLITLEAVPVTLLRLLGKS